MTPRFLAAACIVATAAFGTTAAAEYRLTILHTNDIHARFEPINQFNSTCKPEDNEAGKCFGGVARLKTAIDAARARHETSLLIDAGDPFQGSLFYTYYKGQMAARTMQAMGYAAMAVGNHEFDDGPEVLRQFIDAVGFPVLMSNADVSREDHLKGAVEKSIIVERGGARIGIIGLTPQNNAELASPGPNINFTDPAEAVQHEVDRLEAEGINKIILLSHSGYWVDLELAKTTTGVDVIVGGHSHTYLGEGSNAGPYPTMVGGTAIVQAFAYSKFLGELEVVFDDAGTLIAASGAPILMDASVAEDPDIKAMVSEAAMPLNEIRETVVGEAAGALDGSGETCRAGVCAMGVAIAEAMLDRVRDQGIEVALQNSGGVRASIAEGEVTMGDVLEVLPFQNTLSTFRVTGAELKAALENGVSQVEMGAGRFPQVAGVRFSYDPTAPAGARIIDVSVGGAPLEPDRLYGMASNDYLRNGGDGYEMFVNAQDAYDFGPDVADVLAEYLAANGPYAPVVDDRIKAVSP